MTEPSRREQIVAIIQHYLQSRFGSEYAVVDAILALDAGEPVAWRIRRGDSNIWAYCETESDADFWGGAGQMKYAKEPLYALPPPPHPEGKDRT